MVDITVLANMFTFLCIRQIINVALYTHCKLLEIKYWNNPQLYIIRARSDLPSDNCATNNLGRL